MKDKDNIFINPEAKLNQTIENEILTKYFELGYDDNDMQIDQIYSFLVDSLEIPHILIDQYLKHNNFDNLSLEGLKIVDFELLVEFCYKVIIIKNNFEIIKDYWRLFMNEISVRKDIYNYEINYQDLIKVINNLKLKIKNAMVIDMLAVTNGNLINLYNFSIILGKVGELI